MKASVYYVDVPENLFLSSWDTPVGKAYLDAKRFKYQDAAVLGLVNKIATVEVADDKTGDWAAEDVWMFFQNGVKLKTTTRVLSLNRTVKRRSMDVGDLIVWENGVVQAVDSVGFRVVTDFNPETNVPPGLEKFQS